MGGSPSGHTGVFKQAAGPHIAHIVHQPSLSERKRMEDLQRSKTGLQDSSSALSLSSPNLWVQLNAAPPHSPASRTHTGGIGGGFCRGSDGRPPPGSAARSPHQTPPSQPTPRPPRSPRLMVGCTVGGGGPPLRSAPLRAVRSLPTPTDSSRRARPAPAASFLPRPGVGGCYRAGGGAWGSGGFGEGRGSVGTRRGISSIGATIVPSRRRPPNPTEPQPRHP